MNKSKSIIDTGKVKRIFGKDIPILAVDNFQKEIKQFGMAGGHIHFPKKYVGAIANVSILGLKPFVCKKCHEVFTQEKHFSPETDMCRFCYWERQRLEKYRKLPKEKQVCEMCKKYLSPEDFRENWSSGLHLECKQKLIQMVDDGEIEGEENDYILDEEKLKSEGDNNS
jgi:putative transposon-encoded protein